jgi:sec-independent protein translocase protein TatB
MMMTPPIEAANVGMWDSLFLMVLALVVFGPRRLPEIGRQIGRLMYEVRKASNDFKFQMEEELRKAEEADRQKKLAAATLATPLAESQAAFTETVSPVASPYPGEGVYPAVSPADFHADEPYPRIQPPATGEPVEAERPGRMAQPLEMPAAETTSESNPVATSAAEQVRHD